MRVLLPIDGSVNSKQAAEMVKHLTPPVQLHVLHVVDIWSLKNSYLAADYSEAEFETYRQEVSNLSQDLLHEIRDKLTPHIQEIQLIADSGDPAESIIRTAEETQTDLIIMGHRGMTAKSSFLLGGVSQKVATYAPCSVLIVKEPMPELNAILLAVDGSDISNKAIDFLAACPFKTPLRVIVNTVWAPPPLGTTEVTSAEQPHTLDHSAPKTKGEEYLNAAAERIREGSYETQVDWRYGDPPMAILDSACHHKVNIVVVGARGLTGIKRFFLGSVSQKVLMHGTCSVLIVR